MKYCCMMALVLTVAFFLSSTGRCLFPRLDVATAANGQGQPFVVPRGEF